MQLLPLQIPKSQKNSQVKQLYYAFGPALVKVGRKHVDEIDPRSQVIEGVNPIWVVVETRGAIKVAKI